MFGPVPQENYCGLPCPEMHFGSLDVGEVEASVGHDWEFGGVKHFGP